MQVNVRELKGNWDLGYALDDYSSHSRLIFMDDEGHAAYETVTRRPVYTDEQGNTDLESYRTECGQKLYELKYLHEISAAQPISNALAEAIFPLFGRVDLIVPVPPSVPRRIQPVMELATRLGQLTDTHVADGLITKQPAIRPMKGVPTRIQRIAELRGRIRLKSSTITSGGPFNVLVLDDIIDTGATMQTVCEALNGWDKIRRIYVAAVAIGSRYADSYIHGIDPIPILADK